MNTTPNDKLHIPIRRQGHRTRSCFPKTAAGEANYKMDALSMEIDHLRQARDYINDIMPELFAKLHALAKIVDADDS